MSDCITKIGDFAFAGTAIMIISLAEYRCSAPTIPRGAHREYPLIAH